MQPLSVFTPDTAKWLGVQHGTDAFYLFMGPMLRTAEDRQMSHDMITAVTTFARSGQPAVMGGVKWTEAIDRTKNSSDKATRYMSLHVNKYQMVTDYYVPTCNQFWYSRIVLQ